jgi:ATP-dependent Clp protease ATP-binding subunit ClpC
MMDRDLTIELEEPAKRQLIKLGFDPALGARPLRRAVQHEIEDRLSEKILHGELNAGDHVHVDFVVPADGPGEFVFTTGRQAGLPEKEPAAVEA